MNSDSDRSAVQPLATCDVAFIATSRTNSDLGKCGYTAITVIMVHYRILGLEDVQLL